jgi:N-acetylneuraminic acid mutarotase
MSSEASAVYSPINNKVYLFGGEDVGAAVVSNATRIYDIASNTWSAGATMPDVRAFMASGYFAGKIYLIGGYSTGNVTPSFGQVWEYDPVTNTFNTSRLNMPATLGGPGYGVINGHIYVAGGRDGVTAALNTLYDYDIVANTWATRANLLSVSTYRAAEC